MHGRTLRQLIRAELDAELGQDAGSITMALSGGVVTLSGEAATPATASAAERAAQRVPGVARVVLMIKVTPSPASGGSDGAAAAPGGEAAHTGRVNDWINRAANRNGRRP